MDAILDLPLSKVAICTSHNSYLTGSQVGFGGNGTAEGIRTAMLKNARMVELDVTEKDGEAMVCHPISTPLGSIPCTNVISAGDCLDVIAEEAFKGTDLPLFLCIQKETDDKAALKDLGQKIHAKFADRLVPRCTNLTNTKISDLLGKVVVYTFPMSSGVPELDNLVTWSLYWGPGFNNMGHKEMRKKKAKDMQGKLCRVYPDNIIRSKNFDPWLAWGKGAQFVAFNFQHSSDQTSEYLKVFCDIGIRPLEEVCAIKPQELGDEDDDEDDPGFGARGSKENPRNPVAGVPVLGPVVGGVMAGAGKMASPFRRLFGKK